MIAVVAIRRAMAEAEDARVPRLYRCPDCGRAWADPEVAFQHTLTDGPTERRTGGDRRVAGDRRGAA